MSGSILLGAVAERTEAIEVTCRTCPRRGLLSTDKLLAEHGKAMPMPALLRLRAGDCPKIASTHQYDRCDVHCQTLSALFVPPPRLV